MTPELLYAMPYGRGRLVTHRFDLHQPKGRRRGESSASNALSVARSATTRLSRRVSAPSNLVEAGLRGLDSWRYPPRDLTRR